MQFFSSDIHEFKTAQTRLRAMSVPRNIRPNHFTDFIKQTIRKKHIYVDSLTLFPVIIYIETNISHPKILHPKHDNLSVNSGFLPTIFSVND